MTKDPTAMTAGTLPPPMAAAAPVWVGTELGDSESVAVAVPLGVADELPGDSETGVLLLLTGREEELAVASGSTVVVAVARTTVLVTVEVAVEVTVSASAS